MQRPTGVTILAVLDLIGAALCVLFALGAGALSAFLGTAAASQSHSPLGVIVGLGGAVAAVVFLLFAALAIAIGIGMLKLHNWARLTTIVLTALGVASALLGILTSMAHFVIGVLIYQLIVVAIDVWIIVYLLKPHVKAAFAGGNASTAAA